MRDTFAKLHVCGMGHFGLPVLAALQYRNGPEARDRLKLRLDECMMAKRLYVQIHLRTEQERTDAVLALFPAESEVLRNIHRR